jgi:pilus assembly protein Flp/PilA
MRRRLPLGSFVLVTVKGVRFMMNILKKLQRDEDGAALVEYGLLVGLIALAAIAAITLVGTDISLLFGKISTALASA